MTLRISKRLLRVTLLPIAIGVVPALIIFHVGPAWWGGLREQVAAIDDTTSFDQKPIYVGMMKFSDNDTMLLPYALCLTSKYLFVSFQNRSRVDLFNREFEREKSLYLSHGDSSFITGIAADDEHIYVADILRRELRIHDSTGRMIQVFSWLPEKAGQLRPHGASLYKGNLYVTDIEHRQLLVISLSDVSGLTEVGELLLAVPGPHGDSTLLHCPASAAVTPDGRILVTDLVLHVVKAFTCNGRFAYCFGDTGEGKLLNPHGIAFDNLPNPALIAKDSAVFDPSGVNRQGRIHISDRKAEEIVVFDGLGNYVLRYGRGVLRDPNGIAIDQQQRLIFIADAQLRAIVLYKY